MKRILGLAMAGMLIASCSNEKSTILRGEVGGLENDTILVFTGNMMNGDLVQTDTVPLVNGEFSIQLPDTLLLNVQIVEKPLGNRAMRMTRNMGIVLFPGDNVTVKGSVDDLIPSGSQFYDELNNVAQVEAAEAEYMKVEKELLQLHSLAEKDEHRIDSVMKVLKEKSVKVSDAKVMYISENPKSLVSAYYTLSLKAQDGLKACRMLDSEIRNGIFKPVIDRAEQGYANTVARQEARKNIQPGKPAPDFRLKNLDNEMMTLDSFKGKYMVLDFWGSWCGWCIKGMPRMKEYYARYKNKVEFVGVNCRDSEDKWRNKVKELELPWVNLYNGNDSEIVNKYAVPGFPTKILIDPDGLIVEVFVGESDAMYDALDRLFK